MSAPAESAFAYHNENSPFPSRRSSPDHGFVFVGENDSGPNRAAHPQGLLSNLGGSAHSSRHASPARMPSPGFSMGGPSGSALSGQSAPPPWMDRAMEHTRMMLQLDHTPSASDMLAAPNSMGTQAQLVGENAQLRARLRDLSNEQQWALEAVVRGKDADAAELTRKLRNMTEQRDQLELELKHNEREVVRLVSEAMEEKLAESFDQFNQRLALNRSFSVPATPPTPQMAPGSAAAVVAAGSKGSGDVTALAFDRLPEVLQAKTSDIGIVPSTAVVMDNNGLPAFVAFDWARPQHIGTPAQSAPITASQRPKSSNNRRRRGVGWPKTAQGPLGRTVAGVSCAVYGGVRGAVTQVPRGVEIMYDGLDKACEGVANACDFVARALRKVFLAAGSVTGEGCAMVGHQTARLGRWARRPDVAEQLELYLGLAIVLLAGHISLRKLRKQPPCPTKQGHTSRAILVDPEAAHAPSSKHHTTGNIIEEVDGQTAPDATSNLWDQFTLSVPSLPPLPSLPEITIDEVKDGDVAIHIDGHTITLPRFLHVSCLKDDSDEPVSA
ncbi:hypothetical protein WJX73_004358 [Symbiochloris irregularis]|uniref:Uncharacterized protein n=1 Tax=Symbiochloris irregularis TaxID=706552 RepID=A0AAW1P356_9CHLO